MTEETAATDTAGTPKVEREKSPGEQLIDRNDKLKAIRDRLRPEIITHAQVATIKRDDGEIDSYQIVTGRTLQPWGGTIPVAISGDQFADSAVSIYASAWHDGFHAALQLIAEGVAEGLFDAPPKEGDA